MHKIMSFIDLQNPQPCQFPCNDVNAKTRPMLLPWRNCEGWWSCDACACTKAQAHMYAIMNKRKICGTGALPEWFREWGLFSVKRSNGSLTDMIIVDFPCAFSQNLDNGGTNTDGRIRLSEGAIFLDMCSEDQTIFKQVQLSNLYENNPGLYDNACLELDFPPYVDDASRLEWVGAVTRAYEQGKKKISDPPPHELTDGEEELEPEPEPEPTEPEASDQLQENEAQTTAEPEPTEPEPSEADVNTTELPTVAAEPVAADKEEPTKEENTTEAVALSQTLTQISFWDEQ